LYFVCFVFLALLVKQLLHLGSFGHVLLGLALKKIERDQTFSTRTILDKTKAEERAC